MSSPVDNNLSTSPTSILVDTDATFSRREDGSQRHSPTLMRTVDDEEARERQRAMDVDSAMQLSRARSGSVNVPPRPAHGRGSTMGGHALSSISDANSSPRSHGGSHLEASYPMLSDAEEQVMHIARGGGGPGTENFLYEEDENQVLTEHPGMSDDRLQDDPDVEGRGSSYFPSDLLMNHRDPMLDSDMVHSRNALGYPYSPHEPVIGSYGTHDPEQRNHSQLSLPTGNQLDLSAVPLGPQQDRPSSRPDMVNAPMLPPVYRPTRYESTFDFSIMEEFAAEERQRIGSASHLNWANGNGITAEIRRRLAQAGSPKDEAVSPNTPSPRPPVSASELLGSINQALGGDDATNGVTSPANGAAESPFLQRRQRKLSHSNPNPHPRRQAKLAMFEGGLGPFPPSAPSAGHSTGISPDANRPHLAHRAGTNDSSHERPYRFSFYSNAQSATIHSRSMCELPAEGQSFEDLFMGRTAGPSAQPHDDGLQQPITATGVMANGGSGPSSTIHTAQTTPRAGTPGEGTAVNGQPNGVRQAKEALLAKATARSSIFGNPAPGQPVPSAADDDYEKRTWWLDILSPTDEEMKMLSRVFAIHPLTTEDILMEEAREKIELFRNYYFVCFRGFDQDVYSPTHLEPLNMYVIVFREGTLSFHFRGTPHPQNVRRRIKQLKDYINVTADWISYALIDDITDAFGPLIQNIEYEVDSIDELVLILKDADQSDMLRRIGTCRKKVMGLLRLMGNKADVVKGLAKRCNENWSVAPKSDIGLYLSDIQDHLVTMTQNLNHYEKILSRSHSNYLAQISIEMTDANNQINEVLSKLTALGTVLVPMNLITGLWGMNVHVPGQDIQTGYTWFASIVGALVGFAVLGFLLAYKLMVSR